MDTQIPFIIKNIPYLWLDKNVSFGGVRGWNRGRFSRVYLVPPDQTLYQGYLFPPNPCGEISEYFRGQTHNIKPINYHTIRLNGKRVNLDTAGYRSSLPLSVLYTVLNLSFNKITITNFIKEPTTPVLVKPNLPTLKTIFPPGINYSLIKMSNIGLYSVTRWRETLNIVYEMEKFMGKEVKNLTITDATAGVGGDTLYFAQQFKKVNAVELVPLHCAIISHNLSVYKKGGKVDLLCANYVDVVGLYRPWPGNPVTQNVIYFDPPWGGPGYKTRNAVLLKLDNVPLFHIIWHILFHHLADYIFVKSPKNVNLNYFPPYTWVKIRNFKLICIKINRRLTPIKVGPPGRTRSRLSFLPPALLRKKRQVRLASS